MNFSICITAHPLDSAQRNAIEYCKALILKSQRISQIFFYQDAVSLASSLLVPAQDEYDAQQQWIELAQSNNIELKVCVAAAIRRGILNEADCKRYAKPQSNLHDAFSIVGLGDFLTTMDSSDKQVTFG
ncbi:MAG: sulfurtransferase complex subunit TusD [Saccharospirillaceae bacterium]|nr:sulfurtransferase complex subunit TusD [Pseudomonadales bacterium]NRB79222.1 sulfurtransferase complex subunit TusD [Saccharospirillaceae bacterium]